MLLSKLNGLIVPLLTPLNEDLSVDYFGLKNHSARLMNRGVKNFFILNPFSEQEFIPEEEHKRIISKVTKEIGSKANVLVGCFSNSTEGIIDKVRFAEKYSPYCVVNLPYSALTNELEFVDFFDTLMTKTKANIFLYNDPYIFRRNIPIQGLNKIAGWEKLIGIIDNSKNVAYFKALSDYHQLLKIYQTETSLAVESLNYNSSGNASVLANIVPELFINLKNDFDELGYNSLVRQELSLLSFNDKFNQEKIVQSCKKILSDLGIMQSYYSKGLSDLSGAEIETLEKFIKKSFA